MRFHMVARVGCLRYMVTYILDEWSSPLCLQRGYRTRLTGHNLIPKYEKPLGETLAAFACYTRKHT